MDQVQMKYLKHWDSYWRQIVANGLLSCVLWESAPERSAREDMERFRPYINEELPLLDMGCGSGKQTRFLARYFRRVIGVDVSPTVLEDARRRSGDGSSVEWRVFNALNVKEAEVLHAELGDMNIYMRGVFHVIDERDRDNFVSTLEILLGAQGTLYQIELTVEALAYLRSIRHDGWLRFPKVVQPTGFNNTSNREMYFPNDRWELLDEGENVGLPTIDLKDGQKGMVPADYLILRKRLSI